jgi:hypothetical protein
VRKSQEVVASFAHYPVGNRQQVIWRSGPTGGLV